ncbi:cell wall-associated NlpC family hydrolase [Salsuginibacillus halophilus]|uniref:Cell wall-associated NlpC family hydrolase n=1 Tax=Salsuginibacillus halophilus TaxID=517424 RepID=A0A2P8HQM4_9BACI|nr:NlpC/P60 family protein [Salsuginibacillus halophilus]PSL48518.1 cell wall-associated NlpC family hydrolase [Salsuginibacillus halophilus]
MKKQFLMICTAALIAAPFFSTEADASTVDSIISAGEEQLGTPYQYGGTSTSGFDCSGFTQHAYAQAGIDLPRTAAQQYNVGSSVSRSDLQPGDLVFFSHGSGIGHNGIYIGGNQFMHAASSSGVSIDSMSNTYWSPRYVGAKRVVEQSSNEQVAATSVEKSVGVTVNGSSLQANQDAYVTESERTVVPMRAIFEELGADVQWDNNSKTASATLGNQEVSITIDSTEAHTHNGTVSLDQAAINTNGHTMVPVRFVSETLGAEVQWDSNNREVIINQ